MQSERMNQNEPKQWRQDTNNKHQTLRLSWDLVLISSCRENYWVLRHNGDQLLHLLASRHTLLLYQIANLTTDQWWQGSTIHTTQITTLLTCRQESQGIFQEKGNENVWMPTSTQKYMTTHTSACRKDRFENPITNSKISRLEKFNDISENIF